MHRITALACLGLVLASAASAAVTFEHADGTVQVMLDGKPLTAYHYAPKWDKPFLFPIRTASGTVISRGWPVEPRPGDTQDHGWHRGFWWGHGDINGEDFWREKPDKSTARLEVQGKPIAKGNALTATLALMSAKGKRIGTAEERFAFSRDGSNILIETTITVKADAGEALRFGDTDDGGFGFRLSEEFRQDRGAVLTNSEGGKGTEQIWGKPARWTHYSATVNGRRAGVAIIDDPKNVRHPTGWHARGYSLNAANPFALGSFAKDKKLDGSYTLPQGQTLRLRYLVIIHEGELSREALEQYAKRLAPRT